MELKKHHILRVLLILLAVVVFAPAMAQNTRGDKPINNRSKVRETKGKSVKKKEKGSTRDIANRRLRTKNKSSANRANVGIPQPATTARRPRRTTDRAARVPGGERRLATRERKGSDPDRSWSGDISGYKSRRIEPTRNGDANRANIYPQGKYTQKHPQPKARPFKGYENKTASGKPIVKRAPQRTERAWKGDIQGKPFYPPSSFTGRASNIHPQKTRYSKYVSKAPGRRDRAFGNADAIAKARRMGTPAGGKNWGSRGIAGSASAPFVTRGRKNVYWGKAKIKERAKTRDIAGKPLSRKNFRSSGTGLFGRDSLQFFNRKPHGDVRSNQRRGRYIPGSEARGGWLNDIAGYKLRKKLPGGAEAPGNKDFSGFRSVSGMFRNNKPVQGKTPGIGAAALGRDLKRTTGRPGGNYQDQGGMFTGVLKQKRLGEYHGNGRKGLWNNGGAAIPGKGVPASGLSAGRFGGRNKRLPSNADIGVSYAGFEKGHRRNKFSGTYRSGLWNNGGAPIQGKLLPGGAGSAGLYAGNTKRKKLFPEEEYAYRGFEKGHKRQGKFVGSAHTLWNNGGSAIQGKLLPGGAGSAGLYAGNTKRKKLFPEEEYAYRGFEKAQKKQGKYIGSAHTLWNNNGKATTEIQTTKAGALAGGFQGRTKTRGQEKGKFQITPHTLWNNNGKAVTDLEVTKAGASAGLYQGRLKTKEKKQYPLNSNFAVWNNDGKATTQIRLTSSGAAAGAFSGRTKYHKENKTRDVEIEDKMKLKKQYTQNPHSVELASKKEKPHINYKAGNFASGARINGRRDHNPNSAEEAIDTYHNQASARRTDYQGNVKMRKFIDRRESPDAKFIHQGENNVKEDRTIMTNVKLFWAKLFQKSDSQPANLKEKSNKLRYDKGEKGMWAD